MAEANSVGRVSTFTLQQRTVNNALKVQEDLAILNQQISSGYKAETYAGLGSQANILASLEAKLARSEEFVEDNAVLSARLNIMDSALSEINENVQRLKVVITGRNSGAVGDTMPVREEVMGLIKSVAGLLNTHMGDRYLFAGSKTDTRPVLEQSTEPLGEGVPGDHWYYGNDVVQSVAVEDGFVLEYGVNANHSSFQKFFAAAWAAINGDEYNDQDRIETAADLVDESLEELNSLIASNRANLLVVDGVTKRHERLQDYWGELRAEVIETDLIEASTLAAQHQAALQASFQVYARSVQLTLADYLR